MNDYQDTSPSRSLLTVGRRVGATDLSNWQVLPLHKSIILDSNKQYQPEWQQQHSDALTFNEFSGLNQYRQDKETFDSMLEDVTGVPSFAIDKMKKFGGGALSTNEQQMLGAQTYAQDPTFEAGYKFHPDEVNMFKQNYEASGRDGSNVVSLEQFRQMQANGTAKTGVDYLIPYKDENGNVDFHTYNHLEQPRPIE